MEQSIGLHLITVLSILSFKLAVLAVGYLITKMGYDLLLKGVTGEFKFKGSISGAKADLVGASPGLLFLLLGVFLIGFAVFKDKPFSTSTSPEVSLEVNANEKPKLDL